MVKSTLLKLFEEDENINVKLEWKVGIYPGHANILDYWFDHPCQN